MSMLSRVRTILGAIKDESGALIDPAIANKVADRLATVMGGVKAANGTVIPNPTNEQKAAFVIRWFRDELKSINIQATVPAAVEATRSSTSATAATETTTDLGSD